LLVGELKRLVRADKASQESEDGHADAALEWDSQVWELQPSDWRVFVVGRPK